MEGTNSQTALKLNVNQPPELIVNAGSDVSIDVGNNTPIGGSPSASGGTGILTYQWLPYEYLDDATIANPTATPPGNVNFVLTVSDERGCTSIDEIRVIVIGGTAIEEENSDFNLKIYPNPTSGIFTINLDHNGSNEIQIVLYNITGQKVHQATLKNPDSFISADINISELSKGSYFLLIRTDNNNIYRQIILK